MAEGRLRRRVRMTVLTLTVFVSDKIFWHRRYIGREITASPYMRNPHPRRAPLMKFPPVPLITNTTSPKKAYLNLFGQFLSCVSDQTQPDPSPNPKHSANPNPNPSPLGGSRSAGVVTRTAPPRASVTFSQSNAVRPKIHSRPDKLVFHLYPVTLDN